MFFVRHQIKLCQKIMTYSSLASVLPLFQKQTKEQLFTRVVKVILGLDLNI